MPLLEVFELNEKLKRNPSTLYIEDIYRETLHTCRNRLDSINRTRSIW